MNHVWRSKALSSQYGPMLHRRCIHSSNILSKIPRSTFQQRRLTSAPLQPWKRRAYSSLTSGGQKRTAQESIESEDRWANTPAYEMTFTCKVCSTRSSHKISKQGYHHGTVLIGCPGCKNRHLIADNMKIFSDKNVNVEDLIREHGQQIKKGTLSADGDVEFWDDGTEVKRET